MEPPRLIVFSTPLVSTWVLDETHRVLFDAGDGVAALLEGRVHRVQCVALTHSHRDHIAGLPQLLNLRGGVAFLQGLPVEVVHPDGCNSVAAFGRFLTQFDQSTTGKTRWRGMRHGDRLELGDNRFLRACAARHVPGTTDGRPRCLGYQIGRVVTRLRPELRGRPQEELDRLRAERGRAAITCTEEDILLTISGDTLPLPPEMLAGTRFLLHECTFLDEDAEQRAEARQRGHEHSCLSEVLEVAQSAGVERLALYHISRRYTDEQILRTVRAACARREIRARVSVVLPGRVCYDVFAQVVWPVKG